MCQVFINADRHLYDCRARSVRLHGVATSIRLENLFWNVLDDIARRDGMRVPQLCTKLYDELIDSARRSGQFRLVFAGELWSLPGAAALGRHSPRCVHSDCQSECAARVGHRAVALAGCMGPVERAWRQCSATQAGGAA